LHLEFVLGRNVICNILHESHVGPEFVGSYREHLEVHSTTQFGDVSVFGATKFETDPENDVTDDKASSVGPFGVVV
jgi:hypothetical protein